MFDLLKAALQREPACQYFLGQIVGCCVRGGPENAQLFIEGCAELAKHLSPEEMLEVDANINGLVADARLAIERGELSLVADSDFNQRSNETATGLIN
jgi:hypothetical protein